MRVGEARWIHRVLVERVIPEFGARTGAVAGNETAVALNLGSGDVDSLWKSKPHVRELTIGPLLDAGMKVLHSDLRPGPGVDLPGDLLDPRFVNSLARRAPFVTYLCNVLEHVPGPARAVLAERIASLVPAGGWLIVTVPRSYPYHADPIDTMYRPDPAQLESLFHGLALVEHGIVDCGSYGEEFRRGGVVRQIRKLARLAFPIVRPRRWLSHARRFTWMYRPYRLTCVALRKPDSGASDEPAPTEPAAAG